MSDKLRVLDLFSGIGGFSLGLERTGGFETVAFCEFDGFCQRVLKKHWPNVPCFSDVLTLKGSDIDGPVDLICGGYPCQPFSAAGKRQGEKDDRHLWPEFARLVDELRPTWVIGENVAGHISMGLDDVLADLEAKGYACRSFIIPACAVGAPHRRDRVWTVAYALRVRRGNERHDIHDLRKVCQGEGEEFGRRDDAAAKLRFISNVADDISIGQPRPLQLSQQRAKSRMGRVADGFSYQLDEPKERVKAGVKDRAARLKALGNAVRPDIPMMIGAAVLEAENGA